EHVPCPRPARLSRFARVRGALAAERNITAEQNPERLQREQARGRDDDERHEAQAARNTDHAATPAERRRARRAKAWAAFAVALASGAIATTGAGAGAGGATGSAARAASAICARRSSTSAPSSICRAISAENRSAVRSRSPRPTSHSRTVTFNPAI